LHNDWSFVFVVEAGSKGPQKLTLVPVILEFARVRLATRNESCHLFERMVGLSSAFGVRLRPADDLTALEVRCDSVGPIGQLGPGARQNLNPNQ